MGHSHYPLVIRSAPGLLEDFTLVLLFVIHFRSAVCPNNSRPIAIFFPISQSNVDGVQIVMAYIEGLITPQN